MEKKIKRFLWSSVTIAVLICVVIFISLIYFMSNKTEESITGIGEIYMSEINVQLEQKFNTIINLRLEQVKGIYERTKPASMDNRKEMLNDLKLSAEVRNFSYLALYDKDGQAEKIFGDDNIEISDFDDVTKNLNARGNAIALGKNSKGQKYLMLAQSAEYMLENGGTSCAIIAAVPIDYLNSALYLNEKDAMLYSHIVDKEGNYIIRSGEAFRQSYFHRLEAILDKANTQNPQYYIDAMKAAMKKNEPYSTVLLVDGKRQHIFCTPISPDVDWYLISVMPSGVLDNQLTELDFSRIVLTVGALLAILIVMLITFMLYYRLSRQVMRELEEARQDAMQANRAKSEFLSSMSHDIRTPMNAIVGMTEIALKNIDDSMKVEDCLKKVKLSSKHLLGLINDVLDMSKIESGKLTLNYNQISLRETMDDIINIMQPQLKKRNQYFDIFIEQIQTENVNCDSVRLNQILLNLLSNAVKFTMESGRIDVHLYQEESPKGDKYVRTHFIVKDSGIGMSEEFQKKIWDSFTRDESKQVQEITGTGLGMAITKAIVDIMDGSIQLTSELGKGSEFHIVLDLEKAQVEEKDMKLPQWNILVIDDNEQLCLSAVANLEELGVHADWTQDGQQGVEMIEEHHKRNDDYQFVLIDWKMPKMSGMETIRKIRERVGVKIPVFLISAYAWHEIEEEAGLVDIEGFISKPLFKSTLYERLIQYVEGQKQEAEKPEAPTIDFKGKHILLAEDIDLNWEIAEEILSSVDLVLERAVNGKECVEKFEASEVGFYDAILMDIRMPIMNGYEATENIRALDRPDKDLPIIAMTADAFSDDVQHCINCGMNAHTAKPLNVKELLRLLEKFLSE